MSDKELRKALLQSNYNRSDSKLEFLQDGVVLSNHPLFAIDGNTLGLILYSDEIERCNAVGTRVKKHKLLLFYYLVSNLPKKYCSVLDAINLFAVVKSEDIATYGFDIILEPFLNDLKQHSMPDGYPTNLKDGETICMRASLVAYVADNPTAHKAIGLKESVGGALRKCRFCNADNNAMQNGFREEDFEAQTLKKHLEQCSVISGATQTLEDHYRTSHGINRKSILTDFPHFDMFKQTPPDFMHVLLEGVPPLTLQALIKHYIDTKVTNLATINSAIQSIPYSYMEITDKPNHICEKDLHGSTTLNQDAAKCCLLFRIFLFVVGDSINFSDSHWELYILLSDITEICFASVVSLETIA